MSLIICRQYVCANRDHVCMHINGEKYANIENGGNIENSDQMQNINHAWTDRGAYANLVKLP